MARPLSTDLPLSPELRNIFTRARDTAQAEGRELRSAHLLISMCREPNEASSFLESSDVRLQSVLALEQGSRGEPERALTSMIARAERLARSCGSRSVSSMHLLAALLREPQSEAYRLLEAGGINLSGVRTNAMAIATGRARPELTRPVKALGARQDTPTHGIALHPELSALELRQRDPSATRSVRRARARALLEERSSPVHPALRDAYLRTTPSEGLPAISRDAIMRQPNAAPTPPPPPQRPPAAALTRALHTWPPPSSANVTYERARHVHVPDTDASSLAQETSDLLPKPKPMSLRDRFAARKRAARQRHMNSDAQPQTSARISSSHPAILRRPTQEVSPDPYADEALSTDEFVRPTSRPARALARTTTPEPAAPAEAAPQAEDADARPKAAEEAILDAEQTTRSLAARLFGDKKTPTTPPPSAPSAPSAREEDAAVEATQDEAAAPEQPAKRAPDRPDPKLAATYRLDPSKYPLLSKFGRNLTEEAAMGRIDAVVGRDLETTRLRDVLGKRRGNNPLLVGEPGVGKTAIVEGLARHFCELARRGDRMGERTIIELELGRLISGTHLRGSFSERLIGLKDEVRAADGDVIVFLDELHAWIGAGQSGDGGDAAGELKTALARGHFPCIGATTRDEFTQYIESDPAFQRRFEVVDVEEPCVDTAITIAQGVRAHYERHHRITYADAAIDAAVRLSQRYLHERRLPDKALNVLDLAGSRAARTGRRWVGREDVAGVVADMAGLPADRLTRTDRARFLDVERRLAEHVIGHTHVISAVAEVLRRNYAGFRSQRPIGSLLFLGPTGVGKTELVKALADFLFHDRDAIVRLDMSEFMESHSVSRMIGSPPGYVGYEAGGQLTEAVRRRPYQIVLLDEIEKAHPDILNLLLQLLDEGRLTDGKGRAVDFSNTVVIMTSNLGASAFDRVMREEAHAPRIGFGKEPGSNPERDRARLTRQVVQSAQAHFAPELWNRIDERLVFMPLSRHEVASIARLQLADSARRLAEESDIEVTFDDSIIAHLIQNGGYDKRFGARPMRQTISRLVEGSLATIILSGELKPGGSVHASARDGVIAFDVR